MAKTKISEYDAIAANNTDVNSINIAEGCAPSGINNAIRQVMADLKDFQQGTKGDAFLGPVSSSSLTLSSLTANRVLYTNGSKVVATSDNMQFDGTTTTLNALTVDAAFAANGGATLGNATGDALTINSSAVSIPNGLNFDSNTFVIDAGNNAVGIGTSSPSAKLHIAGNTLVPIANSYYCYTSDFGIGTPDSDSLQIFAGSGNAIRFGQRVSGTFTERMRLDTSGNLLVGSTTGDSLGARAYFKTGTVGQWASFIRGYDYAKGTMLETSSGYVDFFYYNGTTGSYAGYIYIAGGTTTYATSSDARLKENIIDAPNALESINAIKVRSFDWKNGVGSVEYGVIAQELYEVAPEGVSVGKDKENGEIEIGWGFDGSKLVPRLIKAIQEQQAIITDLKSRIETLENK